MTATTEVSNVQDVEELRRRYLANQVDTATPEQRLLMLFDRMLRDLDDATSAFAALDMKAINDALQHAQQILFALRDPLDRKSELGRSLYSVYSFCLDRLIEVNLKKDARGLEPVRVMLSEIAAANRKAASELMSYGPGGAFEGVA